VRYYILACVLPGIRKKEDLFYFILYFAFTLEWEMRDEGLDIVGGKLDVKEREN